ncbi:MAG: Alkaline phosphatase synthesis transcriptional regulatory protein PhoP [Phycisphaerae bacterium]|nr:Alkaline phosphatase synthesis transcriptional regulatory protein PhoP [Phycisphaerae bacterium]
MDQPRTKRVLVVDDEIHIINVVAMKFRHAGYEVLTARDPQEALEIARTEVPDLVITDHQMPGGSGIDLCKTLRSSTETTEIPIILLTAYDFSIVKEELGNCNVCTIMPKPFSPRELLAKAAEIVEAAV